MKKLSYFICGKLYCLKKQYPVTKELIKGLNTVTEELNKKPCHNKHGR